MGKTLCRTRSARYQTQVTIKSVYNTLFKKRSLGGVQRSGRALVWPMQSPGSHPQQCTNDI